MVFRNLLARWKQRQDCKFGLHDWVYPGGGKRFCARKGCDGEEWLFSAPRVGGETYSWQDMSMSRLNRQLRSPKRHSRRRWLW